MSRRRHLVAIVLGLVTIAVTFAMLDSPVQALGSPVVAVALAGIATAGTLSRQSRP